MNERLILSGDSVFKREASALGWQLEAAAPAYHETPKLDVKHVEERCRLGRTPATQDL